MTSVFDSTGKNIACTVIEADPNVITQVKTVDSDGYNALQLGYGEAKEKNTSKPMLGHFKKAGATPKRKVVEFRNFDRNRLLATEEGGEVDAKSLGSSIAVNELFAEGDTINVIGTTKGKGFQGVVKRHGFAGVGEATHGQHNRLRAPGSLGASSFPSKVIKGMRMAGRDGGERVKIANLKVVKVFPERNLILVKGAIPGHKGSIVIIEKKAGK